MFNLVSSWFLCTMYSLRTCTFRAHYMTNNFYSILRVVLVSLVRCNTLPLTWRLKQQELVLQLELWRSKVKIPTGPVLLKAFFQVCRHLLVSSQSRQYRSRKGGEPHLTALLGWFMSGTPHDLITYTGPIPQHRHSEVRSSNLRQYGHKLSVHNKLTLTQWKAKWVGGRGWGTKESQGRIFSAKTRIHSNWAKRNFMPIIGRKPEAA